MDPETPAWLNVEFIQRILRDSENDDSIDVKDITTKPATAKGDNYTSEMIRVGMEYSRVKNGRRIVEKKSLIIKIAPSVDGAHKDMIQKVGLFETEIKMMDTTLKKMNSMLSENEGRFSATAVHTHIGDPSILVFEDLAPLGFRMADRQAGLDLQHCLLAMRGLAKFHATSVALYEKYPKEALTKNQKGMFNHEHPEELRKFFVDGLNGLAKELSNWKELGPGYVEKMERLAVVGYEKAADCAARKDEEFNVINHGDFWVNNMLFRYNDEGKVTDHIFVDFQLCVYTSPAIDLQYFLNTSPSDEVSMHHRDALLEEYHNTLSKTMSKLGCKTKPPSMAALEKALKEREFYGVLSSFTILPLVLIDKSEAKSLDEIMHKEGGYENPALRGPLFRKTMLRRLPDWNARGLLDG